MDGRSRPELAPRALAQLSFPREAWCVLATALLPISVRPAGAGVPAAGWAAKNSARRWRQLSGSQVRGSCRPQRRNRCAVSGCPRRPKPSLPRPSGQDGGNLQLMICVKKHCVCLSPETGFMGPGPASERCREVLPRDHRGASQERPAHKEGWGDAEETGRLDGRQRWWQEMPFLRE